MLADPNGQLARFFGVLDEASGMAYRASFIVSPEGDIKSYEIRTPEHKFVQPIGNQEKKQLRQA